MEEKALAKRIELKEELRGVTGKKRIYLILRMLNMPHDDAMLAARIKDIAVGRWKHQDPRFASVLARASALGSQYQDELIGMLRSATQSYAAFAEFLMVQKIIDELKSGEMSFLKTHTCRLLLDKLLARMEPDIRTLSLSWETLLLNREKEGEWTDVTEDTETASSQ